MEKSENDDNLKKFWRYYCTQKQAYVIVSESQFNATLDIHDSKKLFLAENLKDKRIVDGGGIEYLVKWKGLSNECNSWIAVENLDYEFIQSFENISQEEFEVEEILDEKIVNGCNLYLIKWKDYADAFNSWEPIENLDCKELLEEFRLSQDRKKIQKNQGQQSNCSRSLKNDLVSSIVNEKALKRYFEKTLKVDNFVDDESEHPCKISDTETESDVEIMEKDRADFSLLLLCENSDKSKFAVKEGNIENYSTESNSLNLSESPTPDSDTLDKRSLLESFINLREDKSLLSKKLVSKVGANLSTEEIRQCSATIETNLQHSIEIIGALESLGKRQYLFRYVPYTRGDPMWLVGLEEAKQKYFSQLLHFHETRKLPMP